VAILPLSGGLKLTTEKPYDGLRLKTNKTRTRYLYVQNVLLFKLNISIFVRIF